MNTKKEIVVARYKEDASWLISFMNEHPDISVYLYEKHDNYHKDDLPTFKTTCLENTGNEAETYLQHIVRNYYNLAEVTYFIQGRYDDHSPDGLNFILNDPMETNFKTMCAWSPTTDPHGAPHHSGLPLIQYYQDIFGENLTHNITFGAGAQFAVRREAILSRPLEFWKKLLEMSKQTNTFPYVAERLWEEIFTKELK